MLCNTQQLLITSDRFSILWSIQFRRYLHLAFKIPKARSTTTLAEDKNLLNFFCSWDKLKLLESGFTSQVFAGYAPSLIRRGLILYPSITSVGSVSKMLRLEYTMLTLLEYEHHGYCWDHGYYYLQQLGCLLSTFVFY